jgi:glyoxylase-like metal-dependent hydrolase (beta-lactamase superfamily II)
MMAVAPKVHVYRSSPDAFFVNSFIIEGEKSLVLVDTQFVLSETHALVETTAALQKPLAILITHPHPDHYNGLATILASHPGTGVYATSPRLPASERRRSRSAPIGRLSSVRTTRKNSHFLTPWCTTVKS